MGIDANDVQIFMYKAFQFSVNTFSGFVQKYPVVSTVFSFLFILYLLLPSVFYFLIYSILFVVSTLVFLHFYFISKRSGAQNAEPHHVRKAPFEKPEDDPVMVNRDVNFPVQSRNDDMMKESFLEEEKSSVVFQEKETGSSQNEPVCENASVNSRKTGTELQGSGEEEDEVAEEGGEKAVECGDDDQKNLMDIGISVLERYRRLESLIARRRARTLKNPIQKIINMNNAHSIASVAHVLISRTNPYDVPSSSDDLSPGSAPSVLSKTRNPFDLPYDPHEEKPDLTADSFQQEFLPQKDMFFCRHESFFLGPSFPVLDCIQDEHESLRFSRIKRNFDNGDSDQAYRFFGGRQPLRRTLSITDIVTNEGSNEVATTGKAVNDILKINDEKIESKNEVQNEINLTKQRNTGSSSSGSSSDDDEQDGIFRGNTIGITENIHMSGFEFPGVFQNRRHMLPLPRPIPRGRITGESAYDSSPSPIDKSRAEELSFLGTKAPWHTPSHSIASDLQVEVSELGSPPSTADGSGSSDDGDSLTYEADLEKEVTSGSDGISGVSPSKQEYEGGEDDDIREQLSYIQKELDNPVASFLQSLSSSTTEEPPGVRKITEVDVGIDGNERSLMREELADLSEVVEESISESVNSPEKPANEGKDIHIENEPEFNIDDHNEGLKSKENSRTSDELEVTTDLSGKIQEKTSEFNKNPEANSGEPADNQAISQSTMPVDYDDNRDIPNPLTGETVSLSSRDIEDQESNREATVSEQQDLLVEQVSTNSSTSDSPKSVLPEISPRDHIPTSVFSLPVSESDHQNQEHENAGSVSAENAQDVIDTSVHQTLVSGSETSEEPPESSDRFIDEEKDDGRSNEISNAESATELSGQPEETNSRSEEHIESGLTENPADVREELSKSSEAVNMEPARDIQDKEANKDAPPPLVEENGGSVHHRMNSDERNKSRRNKTDVEKSGEADDSNLVVFMEEEKDEHKDHVEEKTESDLS